AMMLLIFIIWVIEMTTILPQDASPRKDYEYDYEKFTPIAAHLKYPMAESVLFEDNSLTKGEWANAVITTLLRIRSNQAMYDVAINHDRYSTLRFILDISFLDFLDNPKNSNLIKTVYKFLLWVLNKSSDSSKQSPEKTKNVSNDIANVIIENNIKRQVESIENQENRPRRVGPSLTFKNYKNLFQIIYLPIVANYVQEDRSFAAQRVAGPNPLVIQRLEGFMEKFPITDAQYQSVMGSGNSLQKALDEKRLYITDYQVLQDINPGTVTIGKEIIQKYIYHPIALFAVEPGDFPNRRLIPVAIQCYQDPSADNPIFIAPSINASTSERWAWQMAKLTVQIADGNYHEFVSHLGGTHLRLEPIALSTYRKLPVEHPLGALLRPHFEGTLFINDSAVRGLVNPGGTVDKVAAGTLESSLLLSVKGAKDYPFPFNESFLPMTLARRGVDDPKLLPDYPYRDDALLIWTAIHDWVSSYLKLFYEDDSAVQNNPEIQNWIKDITDPKGGQMPGIGEITDEDPTPRIRTLAYLIDAVTLIIFTGSANHAAVNFPQAAYMTYMPNMPLAGYHEAPKTTAGISEADYFALLPSLNQSETQMNMTHLLGSVYYTKLGRYGDSYFTDSRVVNLLKEFQERLATIELEINARNEVRFTHYEALLPSKIPQSINI
ncbi:MAG: lipoxygenase family protein, partial [Thermosynechococcaceae cyanobacterium]